MTPLARLAASLLIVPTLTAPRGFRADSEREEAKWEQSYRALPEASVIRRGAPPQGGQGPLSAL